MRSRSKGLSSRFGARRFLFWGLAAASGMASFGLAHVAEASSRVPSATYLHPIAKGWSHPARTLAGGPHVTCTALTFGAAPTSGAITASGQTNCYTFSGTSGHHIRVRVVKTSGVLVPQVSIQRPDSSVVCGPTIGPDVTCTLDITGTHSVVVGDQSGTNTGTYVISIQDLNAPVGCTTLTFGALPTTGNVAVGQMNCYTYSGAAGDQIRSRVIVTSGGLFASQEVIRPKGTTICGPTAAENVTCTLDATGKFRILVEDEIGPNTGGYSIAVQRLDGPVGCSALTPAALPTPGSLGAADQLNCYTFNGTAGDQIRVRLIKTTTGSFSPTAELIRPNGTTICGPAFAGDLTCALDSTGTQTILVEDSAGTNTGNYVISVRKLNSSTGCTALTFGALPTAGTISAVGQTDCYKFSGSAGDELRARAEVTGGTLLATLEVIRPNGTTACGPTGAASLTCPVDTTGTYRILVEDSAGTNTGGYSIGVQSLTSPVGCTGLTMGATPTAGSIVAAAQMNCYTFSGSAGSQIRLRLVKTSGSGFSPTQELIRPDGTTLCGPSFGGDVTCQLDDTGTHTVLVEDSAGTDAGGYVISARKLNSKSGCTALTFGAAPVTGSISLVGQTNCYSFSGVAGDRIRFRDIVTSGSLVTTQEVIRPNGTTQCGPTGAATLTCLLDTTGTYTVLVEDSAGTNTGSYAMAVQRLDGAVGCTALTLGATPISGSVSAAAQMNCYTFAASAGDQARLRFFKTTGATLSPTAELIRPNGTTACGPSFGTDLTCALNRTGTYTVIVEDSAGTNSGNYVISARKLNSSAGCTALSFGAAPTTGSLSAVGQTDCYSFSGTAGDRIRVRAVVTSGTLLITREGVRPNGTSLCGPSGADLTCPLDTTGTYTILIEDDAGTNTGGYSITVQRLDSPLGCTALTVGGAPIAGTISAAAQLNCYTFSGAAGQSVTAQLTKTSGSTFSPVEEMLRPNGTTIGGPSFSTLTVVLDTTGVYTILVDDSGGTNTGSYTIQVS